MLIVTIFLRVAIIMRYRGCEVWILVAFWGSLFQLAVSPFNWIKRVIGCGEKVSRMLNVEAPSNRN
jgi:hypothetical protein